MEYKDGEEVFTKKYTTNFGALNALQTRMEREGAIDAFGEWCQKRYSDSYPSTEATTSNEENANTPCESHRDEEEEKQKQITSLVLLCLNQRNQD